MIQDTPAEFLPPEAWTTVRNMRYRDGVAERTKAAVDLDIDGDPLTQQVFGYKQYNGGQYLLLAGDDNVQITDGSTTTDITSASVPSAVLNQWTYTNFNGVPILNEGTVRPQALTTIPAGPLINLTNWPATYLCAVMRSYKNFLIALNITKGGVNYPNLVLWSDAADPGTVPGSWDITNPAVLAGENPLANNDDDDDIEIIDGGTLKDLFIVYKHLSATVMTFGGQNIFSFSKTLDKGVMARNCILRPPLREARHVCFGLRDIYVHNGYTEDSIIDSRMRKWLFDRINPDLFQYCHAAHNWETGECWFMYPEIGASTISQALIWNYRNNSLSIQDLPDTNSLSVWPFVVPQPDDTWEDDDLTWEDADDLWDVGAVSALRPKFIQALSTSPDSIVGFDAGSPLAQAYLERLGHTIIGRDQSGAPIYDTERVKIVRGMWPRFEGSGMWQFQVGASDTPSGTITWSPTYTFDIASRSRVDCYNEGRILHVRFISAGSGQCRFLGYDLDIEDGGQI